MANQMNVEKLSMYVGQLAEANDRVAKLEGDSSRYAEAAHSMDEMLKATKILLEEERKARHKAEADCDEAHLREQALFEAQQKQLESHEQALLIHVAREAELQKTVSQVKLELESARSEQSHLGSRMDELNRE